MGKGFSPLEKLNLELSVAASEASMSIASKTFSEMKNQECSAPVIKEIVPKSHFANSMPRLDDEDSMDDCEEEKSVDVEKHTS